MTAGHQRHAALGNAGLFARDIKDGRPQPLGVIQPQLGNARHQRGLDQVGGIHPATQPHFDHAGIGRHGGKGQHGGGRGQLEEGDRRVTIQADHVFQQHDQRVIADQLASQPYAFVEAHKMGAGIDMDAISLRFQAGAQHGAGAALAVGAGHMEHRRQPVVRIAQRGEQPFQPAEGQINLGRMQRIGIAQQRIQHRIV